MSTSNESVISSSNEHVTYGSLDHQIPYYGYPPNVYPPNYVQQSADSNIAAFLLQKLMLQEKELKEEREKVEIQKELLEKLTEEKEKLKKDLSFFEDQITNKNKHIDKLYSENTKLYDDNCDLTNIQNKKRSRNDFEIPSIIEPSPKRKKPIFLCRHYHHPDRKKICKYGNNCNFIHSIKDNVNFRTTNCQNLMCASPRECTFKHNQEQLKPID